MSKLTQVISLLYSMQADDTAQLEARLLEQRKRVWTQALRDEARAHGCNGTPRAPGGGYLVDLTKLAIQDAESISTTWNRDVEKQVERIRAETPTANRFVYAHRMEQWAKERDAYKAPLIALVTETTTREMARDAFRKHNYDGNEKYVFSGPAPTCQKCVRLFAAGIVSKAFIDKHAAPVHITCPHYWKAVSPPKLKCGEMWLG